MPLVSGSGAHRCITSPIKATSERLSILDLGCGTGLEIQGVLAKAPNSFITCVDVSEEMVAILREKFAEHLDQMDIVIGSYVNLDFPGEKYDYVISVQTMHHYTEEIKVELYRKILLALKLRGVYIEGDYVVDANVERRYLDEYYQKTELLGDGKTYHIDIPFSVPTQERILTDAGFGHVKTIYRTDNAAVFVAQR